MTEAVTEPVTEAVTERVRRYILDGGDADLRRLLTVAEMSAESVREALRRVGVGPGRAALDCGCGPLGALAVMAEVVSPGGRAVGLDVSPPAVQRAREVVAALDLGNVEVILGDIHDETAAADLGGPFDVAYTRCFLMHQADPVLTLSRIAALLRPGGWLVAHEPLRTPPPRAHPDLPALARYWDIVHRAIEATGVPPRVVEDLPRYAREAGLQVVRAAGLFGTGPAEPVLGVHAGTLEAAKGRAVQLGVATAGEIEEVLDAMRRASRRAAQSGWVSGPFSLDLAFRKPGRAPPARAGSAAPAPPASGQ